MASAKQLALVDVEENSAVLSNCVRLRGKPHKRRVDRAPTEVLRWAPQDCAAEVRRPWTYSEMEE